MNLLQILTYPISLLWGLILKTRHFLYDQGILQSHVPEIPSISVGNLSFGGTGKTPMVLYLIELIRSYNPSVLSRGHGRKTNGFIAISDKHSAEEVGDEPKMMHMKASEYARFFVCEDRVQGSKRIAKETGSEVLILDDAAQHRRIRPGLNILLTTYLKPYSSDHLVPSGTLRDVKNRRKSADIVVVTKCPQGFKINVEQWRDKLGLNGDQLLCFTGIEYGGFQALDSGFTLASVNILEDAAVLLLTGIANSDDLVTELSEKFSAFRHLAFADHHWFSESDIAMALSILANFAPKEKWIVTTEKDLVRLKPHWNRITTSGIGIAVLPIIVKFLDGQSAFDERIRAYVGKD